MVVPEIKTVIKTVIESVSEMRFILFLVVSFVFLSTSQAMATDLRVKFTNLKPNRGYIMVVLVDGEDDWGRITGGGEKADNTGVSQRVKVNDNREQEVVFTGLEANDLTNGRYGIIAYQDLDGDGKMKSGLFGIPQEPIAASNDAPAAFGPPKFKDAKIKLAEGQDRIVVKMR